MNPYADVDWSLYDFIDLGCSNGGSIAYCQKRFRARRGLGVDLDPLKVAGAQAAGYDALLADATVLPDRPLVRFISMLDFLEHLPNLDVVETIITRAAQVASDFIYIRHPSFEGEAYLKHLELRQYWWYWSGHTSHVHVSDYCDIFDRNGLRQYFIRYNEPVMDSGHYSILTIDTPKNQGRFNPEIHPQRPHIQFNEAIWRSQEIFVALRDFDPEVWLHITDRI